MLSYWIRSPRRPSLCANDCQQVDDLLLTHERVGQREIRLDCVVVATALSPPRYVARRLELPDDPVRRSLGNPDVHTDLAQPDTGVSGDAEKHLRVVGEKRELAGGCLGQEPRITFLELHVIRSAASGSANGPARQSGGPGLALPPATR